MFIVRHIETVDSLPRVFVFIQTVTQTPSERGRRASQRRGQLRFDTEKITLCKRSACWTEGHTSTQRAPTGVRAGSGNGRPGDARLQHLSGGHRHFYARVWRLRVTPRRATGKRRDGQASAGTWGHLEIRG